MSQRTMRKEGLKSASNTSNSLKKEDSDIAKYFKDSLSFVPEKETKNKSENRSNQVPVIYEDEDDILVPVNIKRAYSRTAGSKANGAIVDSMIPAKKCKIRLKENVSQLLSVSNNDKNKSRSVTPTPLSVVGKTQKSCALFKKSKNSIFDNVTQSSSKILSLQVLNDVDDDNRLELSTWGLPPLILEKYQARGVRKMFPWQVECLSNKKILEDCKNLIYSAPTSAGKTLVAELLLLKTVLERRKKVIFILPFVSVVREKMFYFQDLLSDSGVRVEAFVGGVAPAGGFAAVHVAIATIEKANSLINRLMEDGDLVTLGAVVIDELHLLGDPNRGYLLELLLTKLRYMSLNLENVNIQLIGMSATLPNLPLIAEWLDAEIYKTDFRPIPLLEQCKIGTSILDKKLNEVRQLVPAIDIVSDADNIIQLCIETINGGHGILIFCPTKNWCEKLAIQMASTFLQLGLNKTPHGLILRDNIDSMAVHEVLEQLKSCPVGLDNVLGRTVSVGVAFHHAGLTMDERDIIEGGFRMGSLKVLIATSTLSSGVNLPARRVIIRSPIFNGKQLDKLTYHQMIGRAGRMGKDTAGESILVCKPNERSAAVNLLTSTLEPITSCLEDSGPLIRALLEAIASQIVRTPKDLDFYSKCTFVYKCEHEGVKEMVDEAVKFLISNEFLLVKNVEGNEQRIVATCLGKACLSASVPPRDGLFLFEELQRARKCFVLDTELHVIYLVTPFSAGNQIGQIDWLSFMELYRDLPESERRVGQLVGVEERFLMTCMRGIVKPGKTLNIHQRFFTALALHDLVREVPLNTVCKKYNCNRGILQSLQQSSATFAGMVTNFCKELKWDCMELLFAQFQTRLQFGVCRDLLDLLRLPSLNGLRARSLFKHGITTVAELAVANEIDVEEALNKALPFESEKDFDGENEAEVAKRTKMRTVFITGKDGLTAREAALIVIKEARVLLKNELGVRDVQWSPNGNQDNPRSFNSAASFNHLSMSNILPLSRSSSFEVRTITTEAVMHQINEEPIVIEEKSDDRLPSSKKSEDSGNITAIPSDFTRICTSKLTDDKTKNFINKEQNAVREKPQGDSIDEKTLNNENHVSRVSERLSTSCVDEINESDKIEDASKTLRSKLAKRTKSLIKDNHITIYSMDFKDKTDSYVNQVVENKKKSQQLGQKNKNSQSQDSFQVSDRVLNEIAQVAEEQNKDIFQMPESVADAKPEEKKRVSGSSNYSKSPSLFSDSSFLDAQMCSMLEKNVVDNCFGDFEKSNFTQSNRPKTIENYKRTSKSEGSISNLSNSKQSTPQTTPIHTSKNKKSSQSNKNAPSVDSQQLQESKTSDLKQMSVPMTWNEDSWDQTSNIRPTKDKENIIKEKSEMQSPSMLQTSRMRAHRPLATTQIALSNAQTIVSKRQLPDSPQPILRKRVCDKVSTERTPLASINKNSTTTRTLAKPIASSSNQSDSEDSIVSSQATVKTVVNKTRSRIEQKLMATQKFGKSMSSKSSAMNIASYSNFKLTKQNVNLFSGDSSSSDNDSTDSCLLFDSDDTISSQPKKSKKIKGNRRSLDQMLRSNSYSSTWSSDEKIDPSSINPINVANSKKTFRLFRNEVERKMMAVSIITEPYNREPVLMIGSKIVGTEDKKKIKKSENFIYGDRKLCGMIFCWGVKSVYYMPFSNTTETKVTIKERMNFLREILTDYTVSLRCFNAKEVYKMFYVCCGIESCCEYLDPVTADWLMNSESVYKNYSEMASHYFPSGIDLANSCENKFSNEVVESKRAIVKALLAWFITKVILNMLKEQSSTLLICYREIEMPTIKILANMELRGFGINMSSLQELATVLKSDISHIEDKAFRLAGRKFNFYSPKEISQVLGLNRKGRACTNKTALKSCENPISDLVTSWRKLNTVQTKIIFPLLNLEKKNNRMHGTCITHTVTGRVSMHEPNLQTIPRDFKSEVSGCVFSARMAFVPSVGNVMLSTDFCQLELRILAHFSQDRVLCKLLHQDGDIFKNIAARLNKVTEEMVDDDMRQRAKQLCYAMIYGMGTKSLAQSLSVSESEAKDYLEAFMNTYKEIRVWLNAVYEKARLDGYVSTLMDRRRVLPGINSKIPSVKAQAERQAVNTKIQGSAADITKKAMVLIDKKLREEFPELPVTFPTTQTRRGLRSSDADSRPRGAYLVLQLHDELLYEVNSNDVEVVARIVKDSMENAFKLRIPLPVKMKVGGAWGSLEEYNI